MQHRLDYYSILPLPKVALIHETATKLDRFLDDNRKFENYRYSHIIIKLYILAALFKSKVGRNVDFSVYYLRDRIVVRISGKIKQGAAGTELTFYDENPDNPIITCTLNLSDITERIGRINEIADTLIKFR
jgi:hypothetical protein